MSGFSASASASAPGKAILFGEHAVVYGVTAIAVSLSDLRVQADLHVDAGGDGSLCVVFEDIKNSEGSSFEGSIRLEELASLLAITPDTDPLVVVNPPAELQAALADRFNSYPSAAGQGMVASSFIFAHVVLPCLAQHGHATSALSARLVIKSLGLPIGAGLGSSAALTVAVAGACLHLLHKLSPGRIGSDAELTKEAKDLVNAWAFAGEVLIHGHPSGLDNTTSCYGGMVTFAKREGSNEFETLDRVPELDILLTNTRVPRSTKVLVAGVKALKESFPSIILPIFDSIQAITNTFVSKMSTDQGIQETELAGLVNMNHHLLCALGVGHRALDEVAEASAALGYACKLTGAGGGGCAITVLTNQGDREAKVKEFKERLSLKNFQVLQTRIGGQGVAWH